MSTLPIYFTINVAQYQISWTFSQQASSGTFTIDVNGSQVVYTTSGNGGYFLIDPGDYVEVSISANAQSSLIAEASLYVYDSVGGVLYNNASTGYPTVTETYGPYYPSGSGNIDAQSYEY
jgi:hypothetical protein